MERKITAVNKKIMLKCLAFIFKMKTPFNSLAAKNTNSAKKVSEESKG